MGRETGSPKMNTQESFIPALRFRRLTGMFDRFLKISMREAEIKGQFIDIAQVDFGQSVLDFGCGTGTLLRMLLQRFPSLTAVGLDVDEQVLEIAAQKLFPLAPPLVKYDGVNIPFSSGAFDSVLTSLAVHHIPRNQKVALFRELKRVLRAGGRLFILDFTKPQDGYSALVSGVLRLLEPIGDNIQGRIPRMLARAGFVEIRQEGYFKTAFGALSVVQGTVDVSSSPASFAHIPPP